VLWVLVCLFSHAGSQALASVEHLSRGGVLIWGPLLPPPRLLAEPARTRCLGDLRARQVWLKFPTGLGIAGVAELSGDNSAGGLGFPGKPGGKGRGASRWELSCSGTCTATAELNSQTPRWSWRRYRVVPLVPGFVESCASDEYESQKITCMETRNQFSASFGTVIYPEVVLHVDKVRENVGVH